MPQLNEILDGKAFRLKRVVNALFVCGVCVCACMMVCDGVCVCVCVYAVCVCACMRCVCACVQVDYTRMPQFARTLASSP